MVETMGVRKVHMMVANWVLYLAVLSAALLVGLMALRLVETIVSMACKMVVLTVV